MSNAIFMRRTVRQMAIGVRSSTGNVAKLVRGAGGTILLKIVSAALLLASQVVFARILGVESFGVFSIAYAWVNVLIILSRQGFDVAAVRYVAAYRAAGQWGLVKGFLKFGQHTVLWSSFAVAAATALVVSQLGSSLSPETRNALYIAAAALPVFAMGQFYNSVLRGLQFIVSPQAFHTVLLPAVMVLALPSAVFAFGAPANATTAMAVYLIAMGVAFIGLCQMYRSKRPAEILDARPEFAAREWLGASFAMMFFMSFGSIVGQANVILLGALEGSAAAGLFGASQRIANILQLIVISVNVAIASMASDLHGRGETGELQRVTRVGVNAIFAVSGLVALVAMIFGDAILGLLGDEFRPAYPLMTLLLFGQLIFAATAPAGILLNMTGHHRVSAKILAASAIVNVVGCLFLIPAYGAIGAAAATVATMAVWNVSMAWVAYRRLRIRAFVG